MDTCSWLATLLDQERLETISGVLIAPRPTPDASLPSKSGEEVARELGGRYLMRYLLPGQLGRFTPGSSDLHFVTPTPYMPGETVAWLGLPAGSQPRTHVMLLDPRHLAVLLGPRWVAFGKGIEYLLPQGFPAAALVGPGPQGAKWELRIS